MSSKNDLQEMHDDLFRRARNIKNTANRFCFLRESILICDSYWDEVDRSRLVKKMVTTFLKDYNLRPEFRTDLRMLDMWRLLGKYSKEYGMAGVLEKVDETGYFRKEVKFYEMWASYFSAERRWEDMERVIEKCRRRCTLSDGQLDVHFGHLGPNPKKPEDNEPSLHVTVKESIVTPNPVAVGRTSPLAAAGRRNNTSTPSPQNAHPPLAEAPTALSAPPTVEEKMEEDGEELTPPPPREPQKDNEVPVPVQEFVPPQSVEPQTAALPVATDGRNNHNSAPSPQYAQTPLAETPLPRAASPHPEEKMEEDGEELAPPRISEQQKEKEMLVQEFVPSTQQEEKEQLAETPMTRAASPPPEEKMEEDGDELAPPPPKEQHKETEPLAPKLVTPPRKQQKEMEQSVAPRAAALSLPTHEEVQYSLEADEQKENCTYELDPFASPVAKKHKDRVTGSSPQILASLTRQEPPQQQPSFPRSAFADINIEQSIWENSAFEKELPQTPSSVPSDRRGCPSPSKKVMRDATLERSSACLKPAFTRSIFADPNVEHSVLENSAFEKELPLTPSSVSSGRRGGPSLMQEAMCDNTTTSDSSFEGSPVCLKPVLPRATFADPNIEQSAWESSAFEKDLPKTPLCVPGDRRGGPSLMQEAMGDNSCDSSFEGSPVTLKPAFRQAIVADPNVGQSDRESSVSQKELPQTPLIVHIDRRCGLSPIIEVMSDSTYEGSPAAPKPAFPRAIFADPNIEQSIWESSLSEKELPQTPSSVSTRGGASPIREVMRDATFEDSPACPKPVVPHTTFADPNVEQSAWESSALDKELHQTPSSVSGGRRGGPSLMQEATGNTTLKSSPVCLKPALPRATFADPNVEMSAWEISAFDVSQAPSRVPTDRQGGPSSAGEVMHDATLEGSPVCLKPAFPRATFADPNVEMSAWEISAFDVSHAPSSVPTDRQGGPSSAGEVMHDATLEGSPVCLKPAFPRATFADPNVEMSAWEISAFELPQTPTSVPTDRQGGPSSAGEVMHDATLERPPVCLEPDFPRATFADLNVEQSNWEISASEKDLPHTPSSVCSGRRGGPSLMQEAMGDNTCVSSFEVSPVCLKPAIPRATFADPNIEQSAWDSSAFEKDLPETPSNVPRYRRGGGGPSPTGDVKSDVTLKSSPATLKHAFPRSIFADSNIEQSAWEISASEKDLPRTPSSVSSGRRVDQSQSREVMGDAAMDISHVSLVPALPHRTFADPNIEQSAWESSAFEKELLHQTPSSVLSERLGGPLPARRVMGEPALEGSSVSLKPAFLRATFADPNVEMSAWEASAFELPQTPTSVPTDRQGGPSPTRKVMGDATLGISSASIEPTFPRAIFADPNIEQSVWETTASEKDLPQTPSSMPSGRHGGPSLMQEATRYKTCDSSFEGSPATLKPVFTRAIFADPNIEQTVVEWSEEDTTSKTSSSSTSNQN